MKPIGVYGGGGFYGGGEFYGSSGFYGGGEFYGGGRHHRNTLTRDIYWRPHRLNWFRLWFWRTTGVRQGFA